MAEIDEDTYDPPADSDGTGAGTTTRTTRWHARRTRGALSGLGLMLLGAWGAIIPFVGPYFDYTYTPDSTWTWTAGRGYLQVAPGAVAFVAGLVLLLTRHRLVAMAAGWAGIVAGAWFVVGPLLTPLWDAGALGQPTGGTRDVAVQQIGMFFGLGAAIVLLGGLAIGRFSVPDPRVAVTSHRAEMADADAAAVAADDGREHHHFHRRHTRAA
jgi:hypothetical protein